LCGILQTYVCLRAAICPYKPNKPQGCPTLTVAMTVKLAEPQGCLTLTAIVAVKLRVCPLSLANAISCLCLSQKTKGVFSMLRNSVSDLKKKEAWQKEICSPSNSLTDLDSKASRTYAQKIVYRRKQRVSFNGISMRSISLFARNFDVLNRLLSALRIVA
jgi:hypothetical protein